MTYEQTIAREILTVADDVCDPLTRLRLLEQSRFLRKHYPPEYDPTTSSIEDRVLAWHGANRDKIDPSLVASLQDVLGV